MRLFIFLMVLSLGHSCFIREPFEPEVNDTIKVEPFEPDTFAVEPSLTAYEIARLSLGVPAKDSVRFWLSFVGLPYPNPFCAAASSTWNEYAGLWHPKSGLARHFKTQAPSGMWVRAEDVLRGDVFVPAGSMAVFERTGTIYGHVGHVTEGFTGSMGFYISANTSAPNSSGSEFSGGGVWEKRFSIIPGAAFRITGFIIY